MNNPEFTDNVLGYIQHREATPEERQAYQNYAQASKPIARGKWSPASRRRVTRPSSGLK